MDVLRIGAIAQLRAAGRETTEEAIAASIRQMRETLEDEAGAVQARANHAPPAAAAAAPAVALDAATPPAAPEPPRALTRHASSAGAITAAARPGRPSRPAPVKIKEPSIKSISKNRRVTVVDTSSDFETESDFVETDYDDEHHYAQTQLQSETDSDARPKNSGRFRLQRRG